MPKVDLKLYSTDAAEGKKQTTTITYVNPDASNAVLKTFAQQLNQFTTNGYASADRVETVNVDTDDSRKLQRNIGIANAVRGQTAKLSINIQEGQTVNPAVFLYSNGAVTIIDATETTESQDPSILIMTVQIPNQSGTLFVGTVANEYFYADFIRETIQ